MAVSKGDIILGGADVNRPVQRVTGPIKLALICGIGHGIKAVAAELSPEGTGADGAEDVDEIEAAYARSMGSASVTVTGGWAPPSSGPQRDAYELGVAAGRALVHYYAGGKAPPEWPEIDDLIDWLSAGRYGLLDKTLDAGGEMIEAVTGISIGDAEATDSRSTIEAVAGGLEAVGSVADLLTMVTA